MGGTRVIHDDIIIHAIILYGIAIRRWPDAENGSSADRNSCDAAYTGDGRLSEVAGGGDDITGSAAMATGSVLPQPVDGRIDPAAAAP